MILNLIINGFKYFNILKVKIHTTISVLGFSLILVFIFQILSGIMLAFSLIPECMLIPPVRDEEDLEDLYTDDFFWIHERGVDLLFILSYSHLLRKLYLINYYLEHEFAWKTGTFVLILLQVVTFFGLVLCCTHLSDITLKIAGNTIHTVLSFKTKAYWWLFTDKNLNTDTIVRLAYAHYISAFILFFVSIIHSLNMHYDWKTDSNFTGSENQLNWFNEVLLNEIISFIYVMFIIYNVTKILYHEPEPLTYEIFMWGDVGAIVDIKFNQVAPHWYFRPLMSFLLVIPHALIGVAGLALFFVLIYFQVYLHQNSELKLYKSKLLNFNFFNKYNKTFNFYKIHIDFDLWYQTTYFLFFLACMYTTTFLPNGKYYQLLGGNFCMLLSYFYILLYLGFPNIKRSNTLLLSVTNLNLNLLTILYKNINRLKF